MSITLTKTDLIVENLRSKNKKWWLEISTELPQCIYYFGPFDRREEAIEYRAGYLEDLIEEGATGIEVNIKKCQPQVLTLDFC